MRCNCGALPQPAHVLSGQLRSICWSASLRIPLSAQAQAGIYANGRAWMPRSMVVLAGS